MEEHSSEGEKTVVNQACKNWKSCKTEMFHITGGVYPVLHSANSCGKMHRLHFFQSEFKGLAHFNFQEGICNLVSAFA